MRTFFLTRFCKYLFFTFSIIFLFSESNSQNVSAINLYESMRKSIGGTHTSSFNIKTNERHDGKYCGNEYIVKLNAKPYKVFVYSITPNPGAKALFIKGENDDKTYIHPNKFPYFNFSLSPYSSLLRKNHHFTMMEMGFDYLNELFGVYQKKDSVAFMQSLSLGNDVMFHGKLCYQLIINPKNFMMLDYTVLKNENLTKISRKLFLNDNMILEMNPKLDGMNDVKEGDKIKVPNVFARKIILLLDKTNHLPVVQEMYDEKGLFIRVEITSLIRNPKFDKDEFTRTKKEYGF
jgi:Protein of unknown function (DUF1571)